MKNKKGWHKLKEADAETRQREAETQGQKKPPAHTDSPGGSRQGNAGMVKDNDGAHR